MSPAQAKRSACAEFCHQCFSKDDEEVKDKWIPNPKYTEYVAWVQSLIDAENVLLAPREVSLKFKPPSRYQESSRSPEIITKKGELQIILEFKNPLNPKKKALSNLPVYESPLQEPLLAKGEY